MTRPLTHALCLAAGIVLGWFLWHQRAVVEGPAAAVVLPGGGLVAQRDPEAPVPQQLEQAVREAGGELVRAVSVTVRPRPIPSRDGNYADSMQDGPPLTDTGNTREVSDLPGSQAISTPTCACEDVRLDLALVRQVDGSLRAVLVSDSQVVAAIDRPIQPLAGAPSRPWAAGLTWLPTEDTGGIWIERDIGRRGRVGAEALVWGGRLVPAVRAGWRW